MSESEITKTTPARSRASRRRRRWIAAIAVLALTAAGALVLVLYRPATRGEPPLAGSAEESAAEWYCPMHPHVVSDEPGQCPICRMELAKREKPSPPVGEVGGRKVLYWYDPMVPGSRFDEPGKSPFMDMELVPRYAEEAPASGVGDAAPPSVSLSAEQIRATGVATVPVSRQALSHSIRAVGTIEADETRLEHVAARVAGRVEELHADYTGQAVERGAPLYALYSPDLVATQREYLLALEQQRRLSGSDSAGAAESAQELTRAARDRLNLWGIGDREIQELERTGRPGLALTFVAPISGTVLQKKVIEGQYVHEGTELFLLADLSRVWLMAQVYEYELATLRVGQPARATLSAHPGREFEGRISFIEPVLDPQTRTARVRIVLPNPAGELKPGMFADAELVVPMGDVLSVPRSAVIDTGTRQVVYLETSPGTFAPRQIKLGSSAADRVVVLAGLKEGERVVAAANFFIDSQAQLAAGSSIQWSGTLDVKEQPAPPPERRP